MSRVGGSSTFRELEDVREGAEFVLGCFGLSSNHDYLWLMNKLDVHYIVQCHAPTTDDVEKLLTCP
jgi:hypothetical protein